MGIFEQMREIQMEEGRQEVRQQTQKKAVEKSLSYTEFSQKKVAEIMEVPLSVVRKVKAKINNQKVPD